ncbi:hypothetical protein CC79DRAFT_1192313 [Sarocladium strictum]
MPSHSPSPLAFSSCASRVLSSVSLILALSTTTTLAYAAPSSQERKSDNNPLNINWDPAPAPEDGPAISANALRDKSYLPAQIGAIVGAYAFSLVLVAITLLCLAKKRREHLKAANDDADYAEYVPDSKDTSEERFDPTIAANAFTSYDHIQRLQIPGAAGAPVSPVPNFSYPSPTRTEFNDPGPYIHPSPISTIGAPGVNFQVDQSVVAADRAMAQQQLEEMYKYAFEHEEAKQNGRAMEPPMPPVAQAERYSTSDRSTKSTLSKKERNKPANLNIGAANEEKTQSRTSSLLSALRSPKKKAPKGVNISSPIMTPQSATFPRQEGQELGGIPPRHYAPPPPPPIPGMSSANTSRHNNGAPLTPDISPQSVQSIDERIAVQLDTARAISTHNRNMSQAPTEYDPESATSMHSSAPLVGLPASPRSPTFHRPSLPSSPKPGASFSRPNPPSAVRTGGSLPFRAYESSLASPSAQTTKQTVFERKGPLSPTTGRTPFTASAVPYSPYQPNTPIVPMTPSLVTKEDRKRMKRLVPKTPTLQMVESSEDVW